MTTDLHGTTRAEARYGGAVLSVLAGLAAPAFPLLILALFIGATEHRAQETAQMRETITTLAAEKYDAVVVDHGRGINRPGLVEGLVVRRGEQLLDCTLAIDVNHEATLLCQ